MTITTSAIAKSSSFPYRRPRPHPCPCYNRASTAYDRSLRRWCIHAEGRMCPICSQNMTRTMIQ
ncbi:hypothetical protein H6G97_38965 [Nostoc flagelliforme FACHB-838]|uniref:Uncharacterized protein n=1 Tax=Nostoc flagelliforme FACHB-838 TaxID=2692904 RepID=A0ABR8E0Z4_9NOSO|nr:hypothetical protein [Nostoc flagelliforme]MBD2535083.1 hypothetical protein [Nostoc flagelliforme FACHB-838]